MSQKLKTLKSIFPGVIITNTCSFDSQELRIYKERCKKRKDKLDHATNRKNKLTKPLKKGIDKPIIRACRKTGS